LAKPVPCHYCNVLVSTDCDGEVCATHPSHPTPWYCFGSARTNGKHMIHPDLKGNAEMKYRIEHIFIPAYSGIAKLDSESANIPGRRIVEIISSTMNTPASEGKTYEVLTEEGEAS